MGDSWRKWLGDLTGFGSEDGDEEQNPGDDQNEAGAQGEERTMPVFLPERVIPCPEAEEASSSSRERTTEAGDEGSGPGLHRNGRTSGSECPEPPRPGNVLSHGQVTKLVDDALKPFRTAIDAQEQVQEIEARRNRKRRAETRSGSNSRRNSRSRSSSRSSDGSYNGRDNSRRGSRDSSSDRLGPSQTRRNTSESSGPDSSSNTRDVSPAPARPKATARPAKRRRKAVAPKKKKK